MKITTFERGIKYTLFIPPCDIYEVAGKCGLDIFDSALDIAPEEAQIIALLKLERRDFLSEKCFAKIEEVSYIACSKCKNPCGIVHDLDMSDCCQAKIIA